MNKENILTNIECEILYIENKKDVRNNMVGIVTFDNSFYFKNEDCHCKIEIVDNSMKNLIGVYLKEGHSTIAVVQYIDRNSYKMNIKIYFFSDYKRFNDLNFLVTKQIQEKLLKHKLINSFATEELQKLKDKFTITDGFKSCFLFNFSQNTMINLYSPNGYILTGEFKDNALIVTKFKQISQNYPTLSLGFGDFDFVDNKTIVGSKIKELLEVREGYLHVWEEYTNFEGDLLLNRARKIGLIKVDSYDIDGQNIELNLRSNKIIKLLSEGDQLIISKEIPIYLRDMNMTWTKYRQKLDDDFDDEDEYMSRTYKKNLYQKKLKQLQETSKKDEITVTIVRKNYATNSISINTNNVDIEKKDIYISLKINGDEEQIKRRESAQKDILSGRCSMQSLGLILNEKFIHNDLNFNENMKQLQDLSISSFVEEKIFPNNKPTQNQLDAIEIALNTPDIAIIQGPPGTGKTTVITAIIERLNELFDKNSPYSDMSGQVLVTSFQHDAVENILGRLTVNSLPSIKFGKRSANSYEEYDMDRIISTWCNDTIDKINKKNILLKTTELEKNFKNSYKTYRHNPNNNTKLIFIEYAKEIVQTDEKLSFDFEILDKINSIAKELTLDKTDNSQILNTIKRLRVTVEGFRDDGRYQANKVYKLLLPILDISNVNNKKVMQILMDCYNCVDENEIQKLVKKTEKVRNFLIEKLTPKPFLVKEVLDEDITEIYEKIKQRITSITDPKLKIINDFANELENNTFGVKKAIQQYSFVYGATTQQSTKIIDRLASKKSVITRKTNDFETVIVDEAARANPGDLLIPLVKASKRIILVGDHRQLPHIYSDEIAEKLKENNSDFDIDILEKSMFERLYNIAKNMQDNDGRKRVITLNSQFRMNPILGNFISDNFYSEKVLGIDESFKSPLDADYFNQNLFESPANWLDVTVGCGKEEKLGNSRRRLCEVDIIVKKIKAMLLTTEGKKLTYGIITFYSAQVNAIKNALGDEHEDVVRVGSVDAFQGMEFDVIFLSTVRTSEKFSQYLNKDILEIDDKIANKLYGFLRIPNRLCVAMSRQKKALIVVGDSEIFRNEISRKYTRAMFNYYNLCVENGGVIDE